VQLYLNLAAISSSHIVVVIFWQVAAEFTVSSGAFSK
jgi:hypothetical protein